MTVMIDERRLYELAMTKQIAEYNSSQHMKDATLVMIMIAFDDGRKFQRDGQIEVEID